MFWIYLSHRLIIRLLLIVAVTKLCISQDLEIRGVFNYYKIPVDYKIQSQIKSKCWAGLNLVGCIPVNRVFSPNDDERMNDVPYYLQLPKVAKSAIYCLQCCGINRNVDPWRLRCNLDRQDSITSNLYGYEALIATHKSADDIGYIKCPLVRKACDYDADGNTLGCPRQFGDNMYLHGYNMDLYVKVYASNFEYWRGATSMTLFIYYLHLID